MTREHDIRVAGIGARAALDTFIELLDKASLASGLDPVLVQFSLNDVKRLVQVARDSMDDQPRLRLAVADEDAAS